MTNYGYFCSTHSIGTRTPTASSPPSAVILSANLPEGKRTENVVTATTVTTWSKTADTTNTTSPTLDVEIRRKSNGDMDTKNSSAEIKTLTPKEKRALAKQMAQEYVANMIDGKEIYITCEDPELGGMLYAAFLAIQLRAQEALVKKPLNKDQDLTNSPKSFKTIANAKIFPPAGVPSLRSGKKDFIKAQLDANYDDLNTMSTAAINSYSTASEKLTSMEEIEAEIDEVEKRTQKKEKWYDRKDRFTAQQQKLKDRLTALKEAREELKQKLFTKEEEQANKPSSGAPK